MFEQWIMFILGSVIGSFLNVCIHRMPYEGYSLVKPASHCPHCKRPIAWYDNVPILAYILLAGKCRWCKTKISPRYIVVELLTALAAVFLYSQFGFSYNLFVYFIFLCGLIVAAFIDIQHRIIPDEISVGGIVVGFLFNLLKGFIHRPSSIVFHPSFFSSIVHHPAFDSLLGIIIGGGIIYLTGFLFDLVYFKLLKKPPIQGETESMGGGDVKLLAMIGAFLGWEKALITFFLAPFFGAIVGVINLAVKKDHTIPYGPFLSMAAVLSLFWADRIIALVIFR